MSKLPTTREEQVRAVELAAVHGLAHTAEQLGIKEKTLESWCYVRFRKEYAEFREGKISEWRSQFASRMEDLASKYGEAEELAVQQAIELLKRSVADPKEIAALLKSMGSSRATAATTASRARGEPDRKDAVDVNFPQLEQAMETLLGRHGSPEEITDAELVELEPVD